MAKILAFRAPVKDQRQMALDLEFAERKVAIYDTYLTLANPSARKSVRREIGALKQEMFGGGPRGPEPGAALRPPLRRAA